MFQDRTAEDQAPAYRACAEPPDRHSAKLEIPDRIKTLRFDRCECAHLLHPMLLKLNSRRHDQSNAGRNKAPPVRLRRSILELHLERSSVSWHITGQLLGPLTTSEL